jgi:NAD(P)-dependent dehydrogenase (short-subunit alcohol dehydrogenase family)
MSQEDTWARVARAFRPSAPKVLVLNAARPMLGTVVDLELSEWRRTFDINFFGAVLGARTCLPDMIAAGGGSVVIVSSVDGWLAEQGLIAYTCTKAALLQLARNLAVDHAREGIRVNAVAPGTTDTPAFRRIMETADDPEEFLRVRSRRNPLGRVLEADEVARVIYFLASEEASGMTGAVVAVDGGLTASFDFRNPDEQGYR